jgi:rare lipoprotein A (peptidoglycan hydrolase)
VISAVHATRVPNPPATEDRGDVEVTAAPASEELSTSQGPTLATQSSGPRDDPASSVAIASWYGPGFYGNRTACGQLMTPELQGVAHRTLACGTLVALAYGGRIVFVPVVDRGPFVAGRLWDLTAATRASLGCPDLCAVTWWLP